MCKPHFQKSFKRDIFLYSKANWSAIKDRCKELSSEIVLKCNQGYNVSDLWSHFKESLLASMKSNIPSKTVSNKASPPWLNQTLKRMQKKKLRLYHQAKKHKDLNNNKFYHCECRRSFKEV